MPHEVMNEQQVAAYLHLDVREVIKLAARGQIPCRKVKGQYHFRKGQVDHWIESRMGTLGAERLAGIERGVTAHHGGQLDRLEVSSLIPSEGLAVPLRARTREGVLRDLVDLADAAGRVYAKEKILDEVRRREELCTTALVPRVAMPHPRQPLPHDLAESFVIVGSAPSGIPYGAEDGSLTRLFFLVCCKDERTHLHVLARLARMLHAYRHVERLLAAERPEEFRSALAEIEQAVVEGG